MIAHVVLFEPKNDAQGDDQASLIESLSQACRQIDSVKRANIGRRTQLGVSYEDKIGGKTYSYLAIIEFDDVSALREYLKHPLHERVGQLFWKVCESTMIIDAEMQPAGTANIASLSGAGTD